MTNQENIENAKRDNPLLKDMPIKTYNNDLSECFEYFDKLIEERKKKELIINKFNFFYV